MAPLRGSAPVCSGRNVANFSSAPVCSDGWERPLSFVMGVTMAAHWRCVPPRSVGHPEEGVHWVRESGSIACLQWLLREHYRPKLDWCNRAFASKIVVEIAGCSIEVMADVSPGQVRVFHLPIPSGPELFPQSKI